MTTAPPAAKPGRSGAGTSAPPLLTLERQLGPWERFDVVESRSGSHAVCLR